MIEMCIDILRDPVSALQKAKKQNSMNRVWIALLESCILIGIGTGIIIAKTGSFTQFALTLAATSAVTVLISVFVISLVVSYILKIITVNLGGKGKYREGLTSVAFSLVPISVGVLVASIFALVPAGIVISLLAAVIGFAAGFSTLYRSVQELFRTDMVVSLVSVSVLILSIFAALYMSVGLTALTQITSLFPVVA